jgi:hypothetical protein
MPAISGLTMFFFQSDVMLDSRDMHWLTIFAGIIAAAMLAQALGLIVSAMFASKLLLKVNSMSDSFEQKTAPMIAKASMLMDELTPKIHKIGCDVEHISATVREKCDELGETISELNITVSDANLKTRAQVQRVNGLVTDALETTEEVSQAVQDGIRKPVRQIAAILAGLRAGLETLSKNSPFGKRRSPENPYDL